MYDVCDEVENCDGTNKTCPGDSFQPSTVTCRAAAGVCDVIESCTGISGSCPGDFFQPNGMPCLGGAGNCMGGKCLLNPDLGVGDGGLDGSLDGTTDGLDGGGVDADGNGLDAATDIDSAAQDGWTPDAMEAGTPDATEAGTQDVLTDTPPTMDADTLADTRPDSPSDTLADMPGEIGADIQQDLLADDQRADLYQWDYPMPTESSCSCNVGSAPGRSPSLTLFVGLFLLVMALWMRRRHD